jgi:hypothetical protein
MPQPSQLLIERQLQGAPRRKHHEAVYPRADGEGTAGDPIELNSDAQDKTNAAATMANYWGEPRVIVPVSTITLDPWFFIGSYNTLHDATGVDKVFQGAWYMVSTYLCSGRNAGNAWDEGATVLTVADASPFAVDDLVWIVSDGHPDGEIQKVADVTGAVVTVVRETSQFGGANTGLRWDHTADDGASEMMYLCYRSTDAVHHATEFQFESGTTRRAVRYVWGAAKVMAPNAGLIARIMNATDNTNDVAIDVKAIYNHP